jgi:hypothetical protein
MSILALVQIAVLLVLILAALGVAIRFAMRPSERTLGFMRPLTLAVVFAALSATASGVAAALTRPAAGATAGAAGGFAAGLAEATVSCVFGFGVLAVAWGLVALGLRRQA